MVLRAIHEENLKAKTPSTSLRSGSDNSHSRRVIPQPHLCARLKLTHNNFPLSTCARSPYHER